MRNMAESEEHKKKSDWLRFIGVAVAALGLDLWSKWAAFKYLAGAVTVDSLGKASVTPSHVIELIPGWVHFHVTVNQGAVFGTAQGLRWVFVVVSVAAIIFLGYLFRQSRRGQWVYQILLGMLLAGVIGNMVDRVVYGYVRDMIYVLVKWEVFPWIFNVADSLLCVGVAGMIVLSFFDKRHRGRMRKSRCA